MVEPFILVLDRNHSVEKVSDKAETASMQEGRISVCMKNVRT